ncbi:hypothetical protein G6016_02430, partial [Dietzia aerolata]|nr:hypothetical protein [Dietzia aerolata]
EGTLGPLVDDGHRARRAYEAVQGARESQAERDSDGDGDGDGPVTIRPGAPGWLDVLRAAGAQGHAVALAD